MDRYYLICNDLNELESTQDELIKCGFNHQQLHVLSNDDAGIHQHRLHAVNCFSKTDIVYSTVRGAIIGMCFALFFLMMPNVLGLSGDLSWTPFIFLAIIALGFSTWEGGLWGIQEINHHFKAFESAVKNGQHVLIVDYANVQEATLQTVVKHHPTLQAA